MELDSAEPSGIVALVYAAALGFHVNEDEDKIKKEADANGSGSSSGSDDVFLSDKDQSKTLPPRPPKPVKFYQPKSPKTSEKHSPISSPSKKSPYSNQSQTLPYNNISKSSPNSPAFNSNRFNSLPSNKKRTPNGSKKSFNANNRSLSTSSQGEVVKVLCAKSDLFDRYTSLDNMTVDPSNDVILEVLRDIDRIQKPLEFKEEKKLKKSRKKQGKRRDR